MDEKNAKPYRTPGIWNRVDWHPGLNIDKEALKQRDIHLRFPALGIGFYQYNEDGVHCAFRVGGDCRIEYFKRDGTDTDEAMDCVMELRAASDTGSLGWRQIGVRDKEHTALNTLIKEIAAAKAAEIEASKKPEPTPETKPTPAPAALKPKEASGGGYRWPSLNVTIQNNFAEHSHPDADTYVESGIVGGDKGTGYDWFDLTDRDQFDNAATMLRAAVDRVSKETGLNVWFDPLNGQWCEAHNYLEARRDAALKAKEAEPVVAKVTEPKPTPDAEPTEPVFTEEIGRFPELNGLVIERDSEGFLQMHGLIWHKEEGDEDCRVGIEPLPPYDLLAAYPEERDAAIHTAKSLVHRIWRQCHKEAGFLKAVNTLNDARIAAIYFLETLNWTPVSSKDIV